MCDPGAAGLHPPPPPPPTSQVHLDIFIYIYIVHSFKGVSEIRGALLGSLLQGNPTICVSIVGVPISHLRLLKSTTSQCCIHAARNLAV